MTNKHRLTDTVTFGMHLIFDAYGCDFNLLNDKNHCIKVLNTLVDMADMNKLMEPYTLSADSNMTLGGKDPGGISGFVMIQESHISLHTFTKRGFVTIDLYSCKEFSSKGIIEYLIKSFKPKDYDVIKMERGLKYPKDNIYQ